MMSGLEIIVGLIYLEGVFVWLARYAWRGWGEAFFFIVELAMLELV